MLQADGVPHIYRHMCVGSTVSKKRLNTDYYHPVYLIDGDNETFWLSESTTSATVTLSLSSKVQVKDT